MGWTLTVRVGCGWLWVKQGLWLVTTPTRVPKCATVCIYINPSFVKSPPLCVGEQGAAFVFSAHCVQVWRHRFGHPVRDHKRRGRSHQRLTTSWGVVGSTDPWGAWGSSCSRGGDPFAVASCTF